MTINAIECRTACEAMEITGDDDGVAILVEGRFLATTKDEAHRMETAGVSFVYLCDYQMADGTYGLMTVPVN